MKYTVATILISLWVIGLWIGIIYAIRRGWSPYFKSKRQPVKKMNASVKAKSGDVQYDFSQMQMIQGDTYTLFDCEDGEARGFNVPERLFMNLKEGDKGELEYQGHLFVGFRNSLEATDIDELFNRLHR